MTKQSTTIRLDANLRKQVGQKAQQSGLTLSGVVHLLLCSFVDGSVQISVVQHSPTYLATLGKEADALRRTQRKGNAKKFRSSKELFDSVLER